MTVGLIDVDGHNFPNLALMKLSAWHKQQGDSIEWATMFGVYDRIYKSKVFTFSADDSTCYDASEIVQGGTGYGDYTTMLPEEVEHIMPDYGLYGIDDTAYGFVTRGCPNRCPWCVVPRKEGEIRAHADLSEFVPEGVRDVILLDNNILAHQHGLEQLQKSVGLGLRIDCNQGLDARIIANDAEIQMLLAQVRWKRFIRLACDRKDQMGAVAEAVSKIREYAGRKIEFFVYTLITDDYQDSLDRLGFLRGMNAVAPFAQPYRDFESNKEPQQWQKDLARWANNKAVFRSVEFSEYRPRKGA